MRPLTSRAAARCEEASTRRCQCRCGGLYHGARRTPARAASLAELGEPVEQDVVAWLRGLPEEDPHHVPPAKARRLQLQGAA
jgi:hypothetical protein